MWNRTFLTLLLATACGPGEDVTVCSPEGFSCDHCRTEPWVCELDDVAVQRDSCGDCQARGALYEELCRQGYTMSLEEVDEEISCTPVEEESSEGL